jgi:hypothetical protein
VDYKSNTSSSVTVTAHHAGTANVTLTSEGGLTATLHVTVTDSSVAATGLAFATPSTVVNIPSSGAAQTLDIGYAFTPGNANSDVILSCATSNPAVVSYTSRDIDSVVLSALKAGTATIMLTSEGGLTATLNVTVTDSSVAATGLAFATPSTVANIPLTGAIPDLDIDYTFTPGNANNDIVITCASTDPSVVSVDSFDLDSVKLIPHKAGNVTITLTSEGGLTATLEVTVTDSTVPATGIVFAPSSVNITVPSDIGFASSTVNYSFVPGTSTDTIASVGSSAEDVVEAMPGSGSTIQLIAFKAGTATITVISEGGIQASFDVMSPWITAK